MIKTNHKYSIAVILMIGLLNVSYLKDVFADAGIKQNILGKVIYSDNNSPVTEGYITVYNTSTKSTAVIESASINSNGEFRLSGSSVSTTDEIRIMAYPNDLFDNLEIPAEPFVIDVENAMADPDAKYSIIIKVKRDKSSPQIKNAKKYGGILLKQNFPNPFNPTTLISFDLPNASRVSLKVYNMRGESIETLIENRLLLSGKNEIEFNAGSLPSGIYIYSLKAGEYTLNRKMILIK